MVKKTRTTDAAPGTYDAMTKLADDTNNACDKGHKMEGARSDSRIPILQMGSRFGAIGVLAKRLVARLIRFFIVYQSFVNDQVQAQIRDLSRRTENCERALEHVHSLKPHIAALEASIAQVRHSVARLGTEIPQQIAFALESSREANSAVASLRDQHAAAVEEIDKLRATAQEIRSALDEVMSRQNSARIPALRDDHELIAAEVQNLRTLADGLLEKIDRTASSNGVSHNGASNGVRHNGASNGVSHNDASNGVSHNGASNGVVKNGNGKAAKGLFKLFGLFAGVPTRNSK